MSYPELIEPLFAELATIGADPDGGVTRRGYSPQESEAFAHVAEVARRLGLRTQCDDAMNLWIMHPATASGDVLGLGSHLDSVRNGGRYDGVAGVVAALAVVAGLATTAPGARVACVVLRAEESAWYGVPHLGAQALTGGAPPGTWRKPDLVDAMALTGVTRATQTLLQTERRVPGVRRLGAWLELHIEQGPVLDQMTREPLAAVTGIAGSVRYMHAKVLGRAGHSGATPRSLRQDAVMVFAAYLLDLERWAATLGSGDDVLVTAGVVGTNTALHGATRIAERVDFTLDLRAPTPALLEALREGATRLAAATEVAQVQLGDAVHTPAAVFSGRMVRCVMEGIAAATDREVIPAMASGAGHDAGAFAHAGIDSGMVFVRNQHGSHSPAEAMDLKDFRLGVAALGAATRIVLGLPV